MSFAKEAISARELQIDVESADVASSAAVESSSKLTVARGTKPRRCCCCCRCPQTRRGKWLCACGCSCCWLAFIGVILFNVFYFYPRTPQWEMVDLSFDEVSIPGLGIVGLGPANTSACPQSDACGLGHAKGCSTCPDSSYLNMGCLCQARSGGTPAPPGTVISADTSSCPWFDKCGLVHKGCSKCPDSSWINDGCTCRQPYSMDDFKNGWDRFWDLVTQQDQKPLALRVTAVVQATNPNNIGADTEPGSVSVIFKDTVIGVAEIGALHVKRRANLTVVARVNIHNLPHQVTMQMVKELLQNNGRIAITAEGTLAAKALFMRVKTKVVCHVVSDVMDGQKLVEKDCTYTYGA